MKRYLLICIDVLCPNCRIVELDDEGFIKVKKLVNDFERTRRPNHYPRMYLSPMEDSNIEEVCKWISELKDEFIEYEKDRKEIEGN